jgi:hypothetical protein
MKREDANKLYLLVNSKNDMDALEHYVNLRVEFLKNELLAAQDFNRVQYLQGSVNEIKRLLNLREEVNNSKD